MSRFLEFAVASEDILGSLAFYRQLGFTELPTSDGIARGYAVVSDGDICIGLHEPTDALPSVRLVQANVRRFVIDLATQNVEFNAVHIGEEELHRASLRGPFGNTVTWIEARTFSPPEEGTPYSVLGRFLEVTLPVGELYEAARFWAPFADNVVGEADDPPHMRMQIGSTKVGLCELPQSAEPMLTFLVENKPELNERIERYGFSLERPNTGANLMTLRAPEGTILALREADFIGH
ncbi:MAG: hypothetical protein AAFX44_12370 [Pseudomonadota bacterium]